MNSTSAPVSERASPYQGLTPFTPEDTEYFFGREQEIEIITANLIAERLTLLYGPSGVGKSSVFGAGVVHNLRERAQREIARGDPPEYLVVFFNDWRNEPVAALLQEIERQLQMLAPTLPAVTTLAAALRAWNELTGAELLFIFDQFEEYFLYHENDKGDETFAAQFANVLKDVDGHANFLLAFREDALAKMDFFKKHIPNLFKNYLRLKHLDDAAARRAILKPLEKYNSQHPDSLPVTMEPALVDAILEQVQVGSVVLGETGRGVIVRENAISEIETSYLQLVMNRLWNSAFIEGKTVLTFELFRALGETENIVRTHLDQELYALSSEEQEYAANMFRFLVTPSGSKIAYSASDLASYTQIPETRLPSLLEKLSHSDTRILRPVKAVGRDSNVPLYEIYHDMLAASILDWQLRYRQKQIDIEKTYAEQKLSLERQRASRLRRNLIWVSVALAVVIVVIAIAYLPSLPFFNSHISLLSQDVLPKGEPKEDLPKEGISAIAQASDGTLFVSVGATRGVSSVPSSIAVSDKQGSTWDWLPINKGVASEILVDPTNPKILLAAFPSQGLWRTTDGGETWEDVGVDVSLDRIVGLAATENGLIYAVDAFRGVFLSSDHGKSWQIVEGTNGLEPEGRFVSIYVNKNKVYVVSGPSTSSSPEKFGIWQLTENGWIWLYGGQSSTCCITNVVSIGDTIYGAGNGLVKISNGGEVTTLLNGPIRAIDVINSEAPLLLIGTYDGPLYLMQASDGKILERKDIASINVIWSDKSKSFWVGTSGGLYRGEFFERFESFR